MTAAAQMALQQRQGKMFRKPLHDRSHKERRNDRAKADICRQEEADGHAEYIGRDAADAERRQMIAFRCHQGHGIISRNTEIRHVVKRSAKAHEQDIAGHEQTAHAKCRIRQQKIKERMSCIGRNPRQEQINECGKAAVIWPQG